MSDTPVNVRETAKKRGIVATDAEIADVQTYLLGQGWIVGDVSAAGEEGQGLFAMTRHGLDESQRKLPPEPKAYKPHEPTDER